MTLCIDKFILLVKTGLCTMLSVNVQFAGKQANEIFCRGISDNRLLLFYNILNLIYSKNKCPNYKNSRTCTRKLVCLNQFVISVV